MNLIPAVTPTKCTSRRIEWTRLAVGVQSRDREAGRDIKEQADRVSDRRAPDIDEAAERRPDYHCALPRRRGPRHCLREPLAADKLREERLARRLTERAGAP